MLWLYKGHWGFLVVMALLCLFCIDSARCYNWEKAGKGHMRQLYVNLYISQSKHFNLNKGIGTLCSVC